MIRREVINRLPVQTTALRRGAQGAAIEGALSKSIIWAFLDTLARMIHWREQKRASFLYVLAQCLPFLLHDF